MFIYHKNPTWQPSIGFGAIALAGAFTLFEFLQKTQHDRYESAGRFIERWNEPDIQDVRLQLREILTDALVLEPLIRRSEHDQFTPGQKTARGQVIAVMNFFEEMAIAVHTQRVDERYLYSYFGETVRQVKIKLEAWIIADRRFGHKSYWCEFEQLAGRWDSGIPWWI